jgi:CheY-like chemotaxis protein
MQLPVNSHSVLIAEDEVLIREALRQELDKHYNVVAAVGDGQAALDCVEKDRPDVALLDISMPVMNGFGRSQTDFRSCAGSEDHFRNKPC